MVQGADIDIRVVRDGRGPDCNVWSNFKQVKYLPVKWLFNYSWNIFSDCTFFFGSMVYQCQSLFWERIITFLLGVRDSERLFLVLCCCFVWWSVFNFSCLKVTSKLAHTFQCWFSFDQNGGEFGWGHCLEAFRCFSPVNKNFFSFIKKNKNKNIYIVRDLFSFKKIYI